MLIEFTVGNYLSFKDKKTLSLEATAIKDNPENLVSLSKHNLLKGAVIYGANSSGKSNFIKAMEKMREIIITSALHNSTSEIDVTPFLLSTETENQPSHFEMLFIIDDIRYRYGFETDNKIIHAEWLFESKAVSEKALFIREKNSIEITKAFKEGKGIEEKTRDNGLYLSVIDQFNGNISKKIMQWFNSQNIFSGISHENEKRLTSSFIKHNNLKTWIKDFLTPLNLGFEDFELKNDKIVTIHHKRNEHGKIVDTSEFDLVEQESSGTNKLYDMAGSITSGLKMGKLTIIDELDAKLHPLLTMAIVKLFHSPEFNPLNAQLIFATHDTNLLSSGCFRRDQIYFTEKDRLDATDIYSLAEYIEPDGKKVRNDRSYEKDYIAGRYGAVPYLGDFSKILEHGKGS